MFILDGKQTRGKVDRYRRPEYKPTHLNFPKTNVGNINNIHKALLFTALFLKYLHKACVKINLFAQKGNISIINEARSWTLTRRVENNEILNII